MVGNLTQNFAHKAGHLTTEETLVSGLKPNDFVIYYRDECLLSSRQTAPFHFCFCCGILLSFRYYQKSVTGNV